VRRFPAFGKFERSPAEEYPRGKVDPPGRGTVCGRIAEPLPRFTSLSLLGRDMLAGFGRSALPILGRAAPERWPLVIPAPFIPPALGGCGTERPHLPPLLSGDMGPRSAIRIFLLGEAPIPRSAVFIGRSTLCSPVGRCTPAFLTGVAVRWLFIGPFARCASAFQFGREPIPYPELVLVLARALAEAVARLITGREKLRGGGAAALLPAFPPSLEATVGLMSSE
jgi:hypothetical protein